MKKDSILKSSSRFRQAGFFDIKIKPYGFTLIEFLVVLGVLAIAVTATLGFLNSILKGTNKANVEAEVKQNGQAVLDSLDRQIRGAESVVGLDPISADTYSRIKITRTTDPLPLQIKCLPADADKNARIGTVSSSDDGVGDGSFVSLTNENRSIGVNISNCAFRVFPGEESGGVIVPAVVVIAFAASQGLDAPTREDFVAAVDFKTTISLRKY